MTANDSNEEKIINVTPNATKNGLAEKLTAKADLRAQKLRHFAGELLDKAVHNWREYKDKSFYESDLHSPMPSGGTPIQVVVSRDTKEELTKWAKLRRRSLGSHCAFIWEKWLENNP